jgi:hypothetical protein
MQRGDDAGEVPVTDGGYEVSTWEPRTALDRVAVLVHAGLVWSARWVVVALAVLAFTAQLGLAVYGVTVRPTLGVLTFASVLPALVVADVVFLNPPVGHDGARGGDDAGDGPGSWLGK